MLKVRVHHNGDDAFIAWKPEGFIPGCRGFALLRRRNGVEEEVKTWVGFEGEKYSVGERRSSMVWPIQKYQWTDYMANPGDRLQYRVIPMVGPDKDHIQPEFGVASGWTEEIRLTREAAPNIEVYFNRGIVAAQWVSRRLGITANNLQSKKLRTVIETPGDPFRDYLAGPLGARLFDLLESATENKLELFAALYELDDPQLEEALVRCGQRAHVILANGSVKKKGEDQNRSARKALRGKIDLHDRMISPRALGHNKFLVVCDVDKRPRWVWTGSQNWTMTGLCTQANNSVLIDDHELAEEFLKQWELLKEAGDGTPKELKLSNSQPRDVVIQQTSVRLWFTPTVGLVDLEEARKLVRKAKRAILFLMFNPGPRDTLLNEIIHRAQAGATAKRLYIRGVVNQDPGTAKNPVQLFDQENRERADYEVVLPAAIDAPTQWFQRELRKLPNTFAMVHSKVVLIDPFGDHPVVITGSHNFGPKASRTNDENLLIIRDSPELASAYATNIMSIYNQYRWRFRRQVQPETRRWKGLQDGDSWQRGYLKKGSAALREMNFWIGE